MKGKECLDNTLDSASLLLSGLFLHRHIMVVNTSDVDLS